MSFTTFRDAARPIFGTVSGTPTAARVAVRNVTTFRRVAALAEQHGGTVDAPTGQYPQLVRIVFPEGGDR